MKTRFFVFVVFTSISLQLVSPIGISKKEIPIGEMKMMVGGGDHEAECAYSTSAYQMFFIFTFFTPTAIPLIGFLIAGANAIHHCSQECVYEGNCPGSTGAPCDPCPYGGYEEEYSNCQQIGGQIMGQSQCSTSSNRICCVD